MGILEIVILAALSLGAVFYEPEVKSVICGDDVQQNEEVNS